MHCGPSPMHCGPPCTACAVEGCNRTRHPGSPCCGLTQLREWEARFASPGPVCAVEGCDRSCHPDFPCCGLTHLHQLNAPHSNNSASKSRMIYFYNRDKPYYEITNFYGPAPIVIHGQRWPSVEHFFQAIQFMPAEPLLSERVRALPTPREAL
jgi:hypothetical protein